MKRISLATEFGCVSTIKTGDKINVLIRSVQLIARIEKIIIEDDVYDCHRAILVGETNIVINLKAVRDYLNPKATCIASTLKDDMGGYGEIPPKPRNNELVKVLVGADVVGEKEETSVYLKNGTTIISVPMNEHCLIKGIFLEETDGIHCVTCDDNKILGFQPYHIACPNCPTTLKDIIVDDIKAGQYSEYISSHSVEVNSLKYYESTRILYVGQSLHIVLTNSKVKGLRVKGYICYEVGEIPQSPNSDNTESSEKINPIDPNMRMSPYRN